MHRGKGDAVDDHGAANGWLGKKMEEWDLAGRRLPNLSIG